MMPTFPSTSLEIDGLDISPLTGDDAPALVDAFTDAELRRWLPRYFLRSPEGAILRVTACWARHDCCPLSLMIWGVLSPGLVGGV